MKTIIRIILSSIVLILFLAFNLYGQTYYYAFDGKVYIDEQQNKYVVEFDTLVNEAQLSKLTACSKITGDTFIITDTSKIINLGVPYSISKTYQTQNGFEMMGSKRILIKFKETTSQATISQIEANYGLNLIESKTLYRIYETNNSLQKANMIQETGKVVYSYPNFYSKKEMTDNIPTDEFYNYQFYLNNTGQTLYDGYSGTNDADIDAPEAWEISTGSPDITVAIIDVGVDAHSDLPIDKLDIHSNCNFAYEYTSITSDNANSYTPHNEFGSASSHGISCAGLVAAQHNNIGIAGIAPKCKIMPIVIYEGISGHEGDAAAIVAASTYGADILSCSFSWPDPSPNLYPAIVDAITYAIDNGSLVIFSAGNTAARHISDTYYGYVGFPASCNIPYLMTIGATDRFDQQTDYSPDGITFQNEQRSLIDVCAPSNSTFSPSEGAELPDIFTLDLKAENGVNPSVYNAPFTDLDYTARFGGTSASAPQVAGVAALVKSVNPCLSVKEIYEIIITTADRVGDYDYSYGQSLGAWLNGTWRYNNVPLSRELGHGRINAYEAVKVAHDMYNPDVDLYISDDIEDFGIEPNNTAEHLYLSKDIWCRNQDDGLIYQINENPEYHPNNPTYVYVKIKNKGCSASSGNDVLKLYWAKASTNLIWPDSWDGSYTAPLMGDILGQMVVPSIPSGGEVILSFEWATPNPANYVDNNEPWHFCLLTRIESTEDPITSETSSTWQNAKNNNNIAWKNLSIVDVEPNYKLPGAYVGISNYEEGISRYDLNFSEPYNPNNSIFSTAEVYFKPDRDLFIQWEKGGSKLQDAKLTSDSSFLLLSSDAKIMNIQMLPKQMTKGLFRVNFLTQKHIEQEKFYVNLLQKDSLNNSIGGELFEIHKTGRYLFSADAGDDESIIIGDSVLLSASLVNEEAYYNWYIGSTPISKLPEFYVKPTKTTEYTLEVIAKSDGFKDYDKKVVTVNYYEIKDLYPNPASSNLNVEYMAEGATNPSLKMKNGAGNVIQIIQLDASNTSVSLDISNLMPGIYSIVLECDYAFVDLKCFIKQ